MSWTIIFNEVELTQRCHCCQGYGSVVVNQTEEDEETKECGECAGLGCHFTNEGLRLANFIHLVAKAEGK